MFLISQRESRSTNWILEKLGFLPVVLVVTNRNHKPQDESFQVLNELQEQDNIYHYWKKVMDSFQRIETD